MAGARLHVVVRDDDHERAFPVDRRIQELANDRVRGPVAGAGGFGFGTEVVADGVGLVQMAKHEVQGPVRHGGQQVGPDGGVRGIPMIIQRRAGWDRSIRRPDAVGRLGLEQAMHHVVALDGGAGQARGPVGVEQGGNLDLVPGTGPGGQFGVDEGGGRPDTMPPGQPAGQ